MLYALIIGAGVASAHMWLEKHEERRLPSGYIELNLDKTKYELGEQIVFTITNHFPAPVFVTNQCPREPLNVYRHENGHWKQLHATADSDAECYEEERNVAIESESSRSYNFDDWPQLFREPGVYRVAAQLDHYGDIPFQDFVIMEEPEHIIVEDHVTVTKEAPEPTPAATTETVAPEPVSVQTITPELPHHDEEEEEYEDDEDERHHEDDDDEEEDDD